MKCLQKKRARPLTANITLEVGWNVFYVGYDYHKQNSLGKVASHTMGSILKWQDDNTCISVGRDFDKNIISYLQTPHQQTEKLDLSKNPELISAGGGFGPVSVEYSETWELRPQTGPFWTGLNCEVVLFLGLLNAINAEEEKSYISEFCFETTDVLAVPGGFGHCAYVRAVTWSGWSAWHETQDGGGGLLWWPWHSYSGQDPLE